MTTFRQPIPWLNGVRLGFLAGSRDRHTCTARADDVGLGLLQFEAGRMAPLARPSDGADDRKWFSMVWISVANPNKPGSDPNLRPSLPATSAMPLTALQGCLFIHGYERTGSVTPAIECEKRMPADFCR